MNSNEAIKTLKSMASRSIHWPQEYKAINYAISVLENKELQAKGKDKRHGSR